MDFVKIFDSFIQPQPRPHPFLFRQIWPNQIEYLIHFSVRFLKIDNFSYSWILPFPVKFVMDFVEIFGSFIGNSHEKLSLFVQFALGVNMASN